MGVFLSALGFLFCCPSCWHLALEAKQAQLSVFTVLVICFTSADF